MSLKIRILVAVTYTIGALLVFVYTVYVSYQYVVCYITHLYSVLHRVLRGGKKEHKEHKSGC